MSRAAENHEQPYDLARRVALNLRTRCRVPNGARILVGVSGGSDSVALLRALAELSTEHELRLTVAHFDHRLRPESADDAHFVVELAAQQGVEICVGTWDHPEPGEAAARRARHAFLLQAAQRHGCDVTALAHQLEDQIETVLMRLARGTGPRGLAGMAWRRAGAPDIVRPLLDCRRQTLASYLRTLKQPWREDPSNRDQTRTRNRVRHGVLPVLEQAFGAGSLGGWADSLDDLRALWEFIRTEARQLLAQGRWRALLAERGRTELCDVGPLRGAPRAVCGAALQHWFESVGCANVRRGHVRAAMDLIRNGQSGHRVVLPGASYVRLEQATVVVTAPSRVLESTFAASAHTDTEPAKTPAATRSAGAETGPRLDVEIRHVVSERESIVRDSTRVVAPDTLPAQLIAWLDVDRATPQPWIVRTARPGERACLLGAPGSRKVARLFQDRRIARRLRGTWPIVADAEGIIWVPGIGVAARVRVRADTQRAARLTLRTGPGERPRQARPPAADLPSRTAAATSAPPVRGAATKPGPG